jgi:hypothetical protein
LKVINLNRKISGIDNSFLYLSLLDFIIPRNGRWRSKWSLAFNKGQTECELTGLVKAQVHYFEDGNVQLVSSKDITETIQLQV